MSPTDNKVLLQFAEDIGSIKKGVDNLETGQEALQKTQNELDQKISGLHRNVADLVTKDECGTARLELAGQLTAEATGLMNQPGILERLSQRAKALLAIGALLAMCGSALLILYRLAGKVEAKLAEPVRPAQVIYVDKPIMMVPPDAGFKPDAPARKRPKRSRRRPR